MLKSYCRWLKRPFNEGNAKDDRSIGSTKRLRTMLIALGADVLAKIGGSTRALRSTFYVMLFTQFQWHSNLSITKLYCSTSLVHLKNLFWPSAASFAGSAAY